MLTQLAENVVHLSNLLAFIFICLWQQNCLYLPPFLLSLRVIVLTQFAYKLHSHLGV